MVGNVCEGSASAVMNTEMSGAINISASSDDPDLLKWIETKVKQKHGEENELSDVVLSPEMLVRLINAPATGGGLHKTEDQTAKRGIPAAGAAVNSASSERGHSLHQQVIPAAAGRMAAATTQPKPASDSTKTASVATDAQAALAKTGPVATDAKVGLAKRASVATDVQAALAKTASAASVGPEDPVAVAKAESQAAAISAAKTQPITPLLSATLTHASQVAAVKVSDPQSERAARRQLHKERVGEEGRVLHSAKPQEFMLPQQEETRAQSKNVPTTLQKIKAQVSAADRAVRPNAGSQTLEVDYTFQRWSGDRSVRVSVPTQVLREGHITLLPSDAHTADVLSHNMARLTAQKQEAMQPQLTAELLPPRQERDQQQQQRHQQQQDEEQE